MTSNFARTHQLSAETCDAHQRSTTSTHSIDERLNFYFAYLHDVAPWGVTVHEIPSDQSIARKELQLLTPSGMIFMSGLVSMEYNTSVIETVAADEAYTKWLDRDFIPDEQNWRFFTGMAKMRFFNSSHNGEEWELMDTLRPIRDVQRVAELLQQEYDRLRFH